MNKKSIAVFVTGDRSAGLGHIKREIVLGKVLAKRGHEIVYLTLNNTVGYDILVDTFSDWRNVAVYGVNSVDGGGGYRGIHNYFRVLKPDVAIADVEHGPEPSTLRQMRKHAGKVVIIGGVGYALSNVSQRVVDACVDLHIEQAMEINIGTPIAKNLLYGPEYLVLSEIYANLRQAYAEREHLGTLVSMGGSDPHNLSATIANFCGQDNTSYAHPVRVVYGQASKWLDEVHKEIEIIHKPTSLAPHMLASNMLVTALGMTVYEALCLGLPVACTGWSEDHCETAKRMRGLLTLIGIWDDIDYGQLLIFLGMGKDKELWREVSERGKELVDGRGAERVAEAICTT